MSPPPTPEHALLIQQLLSTADLDDGDIAALASLPLRIKMVGENRDIIREGARPVDSCLVLQGLVCRYKMVAGGRRQILSFHLPGDLPDLQSLYLPKMDHSLGTLTPARVAFISHEAVRGVIRQRPGVADALTRYTHIDGSIFREWIANVGRRNALERIAHVMCETYVRMVALNIVENGSFDLPLTQSELGDATGLSNVHVNRTLKELKQRGLIKTQRRTHSILDWPALQEAADFDPSYLHLKTKGLARAR